MASVRAQDPQTAPGVFFFIVGSARSGTTMLRLMMNAHPDVAVPPESRFVVELWPGRDEIEVDRWLAALGRHKRFVAWGLPLEAVEAELPAEGTVPYGVAVEAAFVAYARARGKHRWGDKTPRYIEHIPLLARLFPAARFVHVVRDGRNVALSYADVPFGPKTVAKAAELWAARVCAGRRAGHALGPERYLELRYEDIVRDEPALRATARRLCDFLGLGFRAEMLDPATHARSEMLERAARFNPHVAHGPIAATRSWERDLPEDQVELFEAIAGPVLSELGYARRHPAPRPGARVKAALARAGVPLGRLPRGRAAQPTAGRAEG